MRARACGCVRVRVSGYVCIVCACQFAYPPPSHYLTVSHHNQELAPGGPAAKLGYIGVGDTIVALDEEAIPTDPDAGAPWQWGWGLG